MSLMYNNNQQSLPAPVYLTIRCTAYLYMLLFKYNQWFTLHWSCFLISVHPTQRYY